MCTHHVSTQQCHARLTLATAQYNSCKQFVRHTVVCDEQGRSGRHPVSWCFDWLAVYVDEDGDLVMEQCACNVHAVTISDTSQSTHLQNLSPLVSIKYHYCRRILQLEQEHQLLAVYTARLHHDVGDLLASAHEQLCC
jgi:hypothetical protein